MLKSLDKKAFLLLLAVIALSGFLIWLAFFWQMEKIKKISDDIQKEQLDYLVRQERKQKVVELGKELGDISAREKEMKAMFIDKENAVPFLELVENSAYSTGNQIKINVADLSKVAVQAVKKTLSQNENEDEDSKKSASKNTQSKEKSSSQSSKPDFSNQLGFSIEITGDFGSFVDFLTKLENMPYFVKVYNFQITPAAKDQVAQQPENQPDEANKNLKAALVVGVYTNGTK